MTDFWKSSTYLVVKAMKGTGNQPGVVAQWKAAVEEWAKAPVFHPGAPDADKAAALAWLPLWQVRPFYTAAELAPLFSVLPVALGFSKFPMPVKSPNRLANELDFAGLPRLINAQGGSTFGNPMTGFDRRYYIVERIHYWQNRPVTDAEFLEAFNAHG